MPAGVYDIQQVSPAGVLQVTNAQTNASVLVIGATYKKDIKDLRKSPALDIIENGENLGYVKGVNRGITKVLERGATHVLVINNDAIARPGMVKGLLGSFARHNDAGIVGPKIFYFENKDILWFKGGHFNHSLGYSTHPFMDHPDDDDNADREVDFITGCVMMIKAETFRDLGLFDEDYEIYAEDLDFCLRAKERGIASWVIPSVAAEHKVSISTGVAGSNIMTPYRSYFCARNIPILLGKRMKGPRLLTCLIGQIIIRIPYYFMLISIQGEKGALRQFLKGYADGLMFFIVHEHKK